MLSFPLLATFVAPSGSLGQARDNIALIAVTVALSAIVIFVVWWKAPPLFHRIYRRVDEVIPGDFSPFAGPSSVMFMLVVTALALLGASTALAHLFGADVSGFTSDLTDAAAFIGRWARDRVLKVLLIALAALVILRIVKRILPSVIGESLRQRSRPDTLPDELHKREQTLEGVALGAVRILVFLVAAIMVMSELGLNIAPLLAAAGVVGIAVGFGAQSIIRDLLAGMFIILEDQYRVGDVVVIGDHGGLVESINLRRTVLRDLEFVVHVIPNSEVRVVKNLTKEKSRVKLDIPVAYKEDLDRCFKVINRVGEEMSKDPAWAPMITSQLKVLNVDSLADSAVVIRVLGETLPLKQWDVAGEFRKRIKRALDEEGIEIPFPHQTIYWGADQPPFHRQDAPAATNGGTRQRG